MGLPGAAQFAFILTQFAAVILDFGAVPSQLATFRRGNGPVAITRVLILLAAVLAQLALVPVQFLFDLAQLAAVTVQSGVVLPEFAPRLARAFLGAFAKHRAQFTPVLVAFAEILADFTLVVADFPAVLHDLFFVRPDFRLGFDRIVGVHGGNHEKGPPRPPH